VEQPLLGDGISIAEQVENLFDARPVSFYWIQVWPGIEVEHGDFVAANDAVFRTLAVEAIDLPRDDVVYQGRRMMLVAALR